MLAERRCLAARKLRWTSQPMPHRVQGHVKNEGKKSLAFSRHNDYIDFSLAWADNGTSLLLVWLCRSTCLYYTRFYHHRKIFTSLFIQPTNTHYLTPGLNISALHKCLYLQKGAGRRTRQLQSGSPFRGPSSQAGWFREAAGETCLSSEKKMRESWTDQGEEWAVLKGLLGHFFAFPKEYVFYLIM